jgi:hypothetical protein
VPDRQQMHVCILGNQFAKLHFLCLTARCLYGYSVKDQQKHVAVTHFSQVCLQLGRLEEFRVPLTKAGNIALKMMNVFL